MLPDAGIEREIAEIFRARLGVEVPSVDTDLLREGLLDSLAFVDLLIQIEQRLGVHVSMDELEMEDFRSVAKIAEFVSKRR